MHDSQLHASVDHRNHFTQKVWKCTTGLSILSYYRRCHSATGWQALRLSWFGQLLRAWGNSGVWPDQRKGLSSVPGVDIWWSIIPYAIGHVPLLARNCAKPHVTKFGSVHQCFEKLRNMTPAMRAIFPLVESLVRLLLVNPVSSATAERSFSSLRRLKTYTCVRRAANSVSIALPLPCARTSSTTSMMTKSWRSSSSAETIVQLSSDTLLAKRTN